MPDGSRPHHSEPHPSESQLQRTAPDAILVCARRINVDPYQQLLAKHFPQTPNYLVCEARRMIYDIYTQEHMADLLASPSARILALVDAPVEVFDDHPTFDILSRIRGMVTGSLDQVLMVDTDCSHIKVPRPGGWRKGDPIYFDWAPRYHYDTQGPAKLMQETAVKFPAVQTLPTTKQTYKANLETYLQTYGSLL